MEHEEFHGVEAVQRGAVGDVNGADVTGVEIDSAWRYTPAWVWRGAREMRRKTRAHVMLCFRLLCDVRASLVCLRSCLSCYALRCDVVCCVVCVSSFLVVVCLCCCVVLL